jgi:hypothetical protein
VPLIRVTGYVSYAFTLVVTKLGDNMCQGWPSYLNFLDYLRTNLF